MRPNLHLYKIGGKLIDSPELLKEVLKDFSDLPTPKLLVHGGGSRASKMGQELGIPPKMVDGRRITDAATLEIVTMIYAGLLNKQLVAQLQAMDCPAIGFSGADGNSILSKKREHPSIDFGYVGDVQEVNTSLFQQLLNQGYAPICCAITHDGHGQLLNTNADTVAQMLGSALTLYFKVSLYYIFEKPGVLADPSDDRSVIPSITPSAYETYKADGTVSEGMIPKLDNAFQALSMGIQQVHIGKTAILSE